MSVMTADTMRQRLKEAWLVLSGQRTLTQAWQAGYDCGVSQEFRRVVVGGGDLEPVLRVLRAVNDVFDGKSGYLGLEHAFLAYKDWRASLKLISQPWMGRWPGATF